MVFNQLRAFPLLMSLDGFQKREQLVGCQKSGVERILHLILAKRLRSGREKILYPYLMVFIRVVPNQLKCL